MKKTQEEIQTLNNIQSARQSHTSARIKETFCLSLPPCLSESWQRCVGTWLLGLEGTEKDGVKDAEMEGKNLPNLQMRHVDDP